MSIRRSTLLPCLLLFVGLSARAQVQLGIEGGVEFARLLDALNYYNSSGSVGNLNSTSRTFVYGDVFTDIPLDKKKRFLLRPRLQYTTAGGQTPWLIDFNGNALAIATRYSLQYLALPTQFLFSPQWPSGKPFIGAGLYPAYLLSANARNGQSLNSSTFGESYSISSAVKKWDFGFNATAGFTLNCGVLLGIDFQQGFASIAKKNPFSSGATPNTRTSFWGVHLGYEFTPPKQYR